MRTIKLQKKKISWLISLAMSIGVLLSCVHSQTKSGMNNVNLKGESTESLQNKMTSLSDSLSKILPLVYSAKAFNDPQHFSEIEQETKKLAASAHGLSMQKPSGDPSLNFISSKFASDMNEAVHQLDLGHRKFARFLIRNATSYCISCHTRHDQGRQNVNFNLDVDLSGLSFMDRAEYHMAIRDFDAALKDYGQVINSPDAQIHSFQEVELAAEKTLAVAVRVKRDPDLALDLIHKTMLARWAPEYLKLNALAWKTAVQEWQKEPQKESRRINPRADLGKAKSLLQQGWKFSTSSVQSRAGLIYFLRASTILHDLLSYTGRNPVYGEALYYAGLAAESLRSINLWTLHEAYYESCIRYQPYTSLSKKCYLRLEALQYANYSDSEGSYMPAHIREHLRELRSLAVKQEGDFLNGHGFFD